MKKTALLMALLMLVLSLAACGGQTDDPRNTTTGPADETGGNVNVTDSTCEHQFTTEVLSEATCEEKGVMQYTCSKCGQSYTEEIPAYGHEGSGASCIEPSICTRCGSVAEEAWGHEEEYGVCKYCGIDMTQEQSAVNNDTAQTAEETEATENTAAAQ